ncbi:YjbF family lipoprotein [Litoribrevibacter albus]|uniref:Uncharacterized protein n=1 Tax=Litoribrevibacter albus TaxID=1473156 RepID=A0AA37S842_9GAMM|nr:YjbF family lipoprotein [Litoribrevibacter albus]GLQ30125.1 hypothetical protein GCM10007876_06030 [Litoribrevibacter albus]
MGVVGKSLEIAFFGHPDAQFSREYIENLPYASMVLKIGMGPKSLVVHSRTMNQDVHWIAADYTVYVTRYGRIVKTVNLPINRVGLEFRGTDPVWQVQQGLPFDQNIYYEVDLQPGNYFATPIRATFEFDGEETLEILGKTYQTKRYVERFHSEKLYWEDENYFWFDKDTGALRQTLQFVDPKTPAYLTQHVR